MFTCFLMVLDGFAGLEGVGELGSRPGDPWEPAWRGNKQEPVIKPRFSQVAHRSQCFMVSEGPVASGSSQQAPRPRPAFPGFVLKAFERLFKGI